jgi:hypothetical protein
MTKFDGASASAYIRVKNATFFCDSSDSPSTGDRVLHAARGDQVGLLDEIEQKIVRPRVVLETRVAGIRRGDRLDVAAEHLHPARLPQLR